MDKKTVDATADDRTANNTVRHQYRVLSDNEKVVMLEIKDRAAAFIAFLDALTPSRELSIAKTKLEEAAMWAVKHVTK